MSDKSGVSIQKIGSDGKIIAGSGRVWKWRVSLGKKITGSARQRRFFDTNSDAKEFVDGALQARGEKGTRALMLPSHEMHEAEVCLGRLKEVGATLTQATSFYLKHHRPAHLSRSFAQVAAELLRTKRKNHRRRSTIRVYAGCFRRFGDDYRSTLLNRITAREIETWVDELDVGSITRRNYLRDLGVLWNFAKKKGYVSENQAEKVERPYIEEKPASILTVAQAESLLKEASKPEHLAWLPYFAISLFAGLRTTEIRQLIWEQIDLEEGIITITPFQAKTRRRRIISTSDNLVAWLSLFPDQSGAVVPVNTETNAFWEQREELRKAAGLVEWPRNVLRHSFGSYHLARHSDEGLTAAQMGNSPGVVIKHYREMVKPKDATLYWNLVPQKKALSLSTA